MTELLLLLLARVDVATCVRWSLVIAYVLTAVSMVAVIYSGALVQRALPRWAPITVALFTVGFALVALVALFLVRAWAVATGYDRDWLEALLAVAGSCAWLVAAVTVVRARPLIARAFCLVES